MITHEGEVQAAYADRQGMHLQEYWEVSTLTKSFVVSREYALHLAESSVGRIQWGLAFRMQTKSPGEKDTDDKIARNDNIILCCGCNRNKRFFGSRYLPQMEMKLHYTWCINLAGQLDFVSR